MDQELVVKETAGLARWWIAQRLKKVREEAHGTMAVNPFLVPLIYCLHSHCSLDEIAEFLIGGHFSIGHATGFGKLIDEKLLPAVFNTKKLDAAFRKTAPYGRDEFDNIDHIVTIAGKTYLLSLKAGRWTIQLGQAVELNRSFDRLKSMRDRGEISFEKIIVGAFYGKEENLTDKYRILRGVNEGKKHDVVDLTDVVEVKSGKVFWSWINGGAEDTQAWVMEGILRGIAEMKGELVEVKKHLDAFKASFVSGYSKYVSGCDIDWQRMLEDIN